MRSVHCRAPNPSPYGHRLFPADCAWRTLGILRQGSQPRPYRASALARLHRRRPAQPDPRRALRFVTTKTFLNHFGFDMPRDLPDIEALEDGGLTGKYKLLAGSFRANSAGRRMKRNEPARDIAD